MSFRDAEFASKYKLRGTENKIVLKKKYSIDSIKKIGLKDVEWAIYSAENIIKPF